MTDQTACVTSAECEDRRASCAARWYIPGRILVTAIIAMVAAMAGMMGVIAQTSAALAEINARVEERDRVKQHQDDETQAWRQRVEDKIDRLSESVARLTRPGAMGEPPNGLDAFAVEMDRPQPVDGPGRGLAAAGRRGVRRLPADDGQRPGPR